MARKKITSSGIITSQAAILNNFFLGMDGTNDVTGLTIYDGTDNTGDEVFPTNPFEADYKGLNGAVNVKEDCPNGIYCEFTCSGSAEVIISFTPK